MTATASDVRDIDVAILSDTVASLLMEANYRIPDDVLEGLRSAASREESPLAQRTLGQLVRNYEVAAAERLPVCQDSGVAVVHLEVGQDVHWTGGSVYEAIYDGIRRGTKQGYLRWSVVGQPLLRQKAPDDAAGVVHIELVAGQQVRLTVASKGFGGENMSALRMLTPADGIEGVRRVVIETVDKAGANSCPPVIVGVGVGGTFEVAALLAKKAVLRPITVRHSQARVRQLEEQLLDDINKLGIGAQGFGGMITALAVNIELFSTHIASLPVAVNIGCHSTRRMSAVI